MYKGDKLAVIGGMTVGAGTKAGEPCKNCREIYLKYKDKVDNKKNNLK